MDELEKLLSPYSLPNVIVVNNTNQQEYVLYAVDSKGENVLIGYSHSKKTKEWFKECELISRKIFIEKFSLRK